MSASVRLQPTRASGHVVGGHPQAGLVPCRASVLAASSQRRAVYQPAKSKDTIRQSFDSEDELDGDLATELQAVADPQRLKKLARHFELAWKISRPGRPMTCDCCKGTKEAECNWCNGTGYLMVGSQVYPSTPTHTNNCPVCKGKVRLQARWAEVGPTEGGRAAWANRQPREQGYTQCDRCRGTGFRANWLPSDSDLLP